MPWRALVRDKDFVEVVLDFLKIVLPIVGLWINNRKMRQIQAHVRCDPECLKEHGAQRSSRRRK